MPKETARLPRRFALRLVPALLAASALATTTIVGASAQDVPQDTPPPQRTVQQDPEQATPRPESSGSAAGTLTWTRVESNTGDEPVDQWSREQSVEIEVKLALFGIEWADDGSAWRGTGLTSYADLPASDSCGVADHTATWTGSGMFWSGSGTFDPLEDTGRLSLALDELVLSGVFGAYVLGDGWQISYQLVDCDEAGSVVTETEKDTGVALSCPWDGGGLVGKLSEDGATLDMTCEDVAEDGGYTSTTTVTGTLELSYQ
jgi:hypothetical protein